MVVCLVSSHLPNPVRLQVNKRFFDVFFSFNEITLETGILLIQPLSKDPRHPQHGIPQGPRVAPSGGTHVRRFAVTSLEAPPSELKGTSMAIGGAQEPMWWVRDHLKIKWCQKRTKLFRLSLNLPPPPQKTKIIHIWHHLLFGIKQGYKGF